MRRVGTFTKASPGLVAAAVIGVAVVAAAVPNGTVPTVPFAAATASPGPANAADPVRRPERAEPGLRRCNPNDLRHVDTRYDVAGDQALVEVMFTNDGDACGLATHGRLQVVRRSDGAPAPGIAPRQEADPRGRTDVDVMRVDAGASVRRRIVLSGGACTAASRESARLRLGLNGVDRDAHIDPSRLRGCSADEGGSSASFEPWMPALPASYTTPLPEPRGPYDGVPVVVELRDIQRSGDRVDFTVRLRNDGDDNFNLDPCPTYVMLAGEGASGVETFGTLNCDEAPPAIGPSEAVDFRMETALPPAAEEIDLSWNLGNGVRTSDTPGGRVVLR
jgi:hypothetical protein